MGKKLGGLIRTARTNAGFTQAELGKKVHVSQSDIGRYERGEAEPTTQVVKEIAKACGVTQKSLLDAMPKTGRTSSSSSKPSSSSSKPSSSSSTKPSSSSSSTANKTSLRVTATEKRLVELYRAADSETKKKALAVLRGTSDEAALPGVDDVIAGLGSLIGDVLLKK